MQGDPREQASREALDRVARESETWVSSSLARAGRRVGAHFSGADTRGENRPDEPPDPAELWGRRVGRALSVLLGIVLTWWLGAQLAWW